MSAKAEPEPVVSRPSFPAPAGSCQRYIALPW